MALHRLIPLMLLAAVMLHPQAARKRKSRPPAPAPANVPAEWPIETLKVTGNEVFEPAQILAVTGLKIGERAGKAKFEAARDRLLGTGAFESVGYRFEPGGSGKGYDATFEVTEVQPMYPVRFEDLPIPATEIQKALERAEPLFASRIPATDKMLQRYARRIEQYLSSRGMPEEVASRIVSDEPGKLEIVFRPAKAPPTVAEVRFTGNSVIPTTTLQNTMASVAVGTVYRETRFRQLLDANVRPLYEARGRVDVAFPKISTMPAQDVKGLVVTVGVDEGNTYGLGSVKIDAPGEIPAGDLLKAGAFKIGDLADFDQIEQGRKRIVDALKRQGHMLSSAAIERHVDHEKRVVDLVIHVTPGPRYVFGNLAIKGLDILTEPAIRKLWAMKPGQPFNADYPAHFLGRIREDGVLDNLRSTRHEIKVDEAGKTVDVTLYFNEPPASVLPGVPVPQR
ncbi:MAG: hypothetical protein HUU41_09745 [Bryobacteraceae bacterium]|nr:hypothetical protein [Bryobacterales bacterium]MEB2360016.1 hypothetical protein [Bryobacterales bacterium]NUN01385.1 hypothetical protein [Bryobacteraceae bacterium]